MDALTHTVFYTKLGLCVRCQLLDAKMGGELGREWTTNGGAGGGAGVNVFAQCPTNCFRNSIYNRCADLSLFNVTLTD